MKARGCWRKHRPKCSKMCAFLSYFSSNFLFDLCFFCSLSREKKKKKKRERERETLSCRPRRLAREIVVSRRSLPQEPQRTRGRCLSGQKTPEIAISVAQSSRSSRREIRSIALPDDIDWGGEKCIKPWTPWDQFFQLPEDAFHSSFSLSFLLSHPQSNLCNKIWTQPMSYLGGLSPLQTRRHQRRPNSGSVNLLIPLPWAGKPANRLIYCIRLIIFKICASLSVSHSFVSVCYLCSYQLCHQQLSSLLDAVARIESKLAKLQTAVQNGTTKKKIISIG